MALTATVHHFEVAVSDVARGVYETLEFTAARHPSESMHFLLTRAIAYCLLYEEGIAFSRGLSEASEPALWVKDLTGNLLHWIEVGNPSADRLHRASKAAPAITVFTHHDPALVQRTARERPIHKGERIELLALSPRMLDDLAEITTKRTRWDLLHTEGCLYVTSGTRTVEGIVSRQMLLGG